MDSCSLCFEKILILPNNIIHFKSCNHKICHKCSHFILLDICKRGVDFSFLRSKEKNIQCIICAATETFTTAEFLAFSKRFHKNFNKKAKNSQENIENLENIPEEIKDWFKPLMDQLKTVQQKITKEVLKKLNQNNIIFTTKIEEIIENLKKMQKQHQKRNITEYNDIKNQLEIFEEPFWTLLAEFRRNSLEASRKYYISNQPTDNKYVFLDKTFNIITKTPEIYNETSVFHDESYFQINFPMQIAPFPIDRFSIEPEKVIIDSQGFAPYSMKSGVSCSFHSNNNKYLAWAGYGFNKTSETFPLKIYDLTGGTCIKIEGFSEISVVCTYPKSSRDGKSQWLCVADKQGKFQGFSVNLLENKQIVKVFSFDTMNPISALTVFQDKNCELDENQDIYAIIAYDIDDPDRLKLFRFCEGSWELIKIIKSPSKCHVINHFYDKTINKTKIYFGFASKICGFDMRARQINDENYLTNCKYSMINFVFLPKKNTYFMVYTKEDKEILVANLKSGNIVRTVGVSNVRDISIWERKRENSDIIDIYLIIATNNSIEVRDFYNLNREIYAQQFNKIVVNVVNLGEQNVVKNKKIKKILVIANLNGTMGSSHVFKQNWEIIPKA